METSLKRNEQYDYIKAISVFMVVIHHCVDNYLTITSDSSVSIQLIIVLLHTCHVPIFMIVAGYFCHEQNYVFFLKKKTKKILIPFIVFSMLKLIYSALISNEFAHGGETLLKQIGYSFLIGRQYWFIYAIFGIYLIAPLFWTRKEKKQKATIMLVCSYGIVCLLALLDVSLPEWFQLDHIVNYLPYFIFGCVLKQKERLIRQVFLKINKSICIVVASLLVVAFLITYIYYPAIRNYPIRFWVALLVFFLIYEITKAIKNGNHVLNIISKYSLQVMFFDGIIRTIIFVVVKKIGIVNIFTTLIMAFVVVALSIPLCKVIERIPLVNRMAGL